MLHMHTRNRTCPVHIIGIGKSSKALSYYNAKQPAEVRVRVLRNMAHDDPTKVTRTGPIKW